MSTPPLHKVFWLWLPITLIIIQAVIEISISSGTLAVLHSEGGPHETLQFFILLAAFTIALLTLIQMNKRKSPWIAAWIGIAALCSLYVAGEEISWGQHFLDWATPEFWQGMNDQGETNLHNTSSWLDQKPRLLLEIGVLTGGIIIPFLRHFKPLWLPKRFEAIYPPNILSVTAFCAFIIYMLEELDEVLKNIVLFERASEVNELFFYYFVLLYLITLRTRIMKDNR